MSSFGKSNEKNEKTTTNHAGEIAVAGKKPDYANQHEEHPQNREVGLPFDWRSATRTRRRRRRNGLLAFRAFDESHRNTLTLC